MYREVSQLSLCFESIDICGCCCDYGSGSYRGATAAAPYKESPKELLRLKNCSTHVRAADVSLAQAISDIVGRNAGEVSAAWTARGYVFEWVPVTPCPGMLEKMNAPHRANRMQPGHLGHDRRVTFRLDAAQTLQQNVAASTMAMRASGASQSHEEYMAVQASIQGHAAGMQAAALPGGVSPAVLAPDMDRGGAANGGPAAELQKLADLKSQGLLTDEEFSVAKAKVLSP